MRSSYWSSDLCSSYLIARVFDDGCQDVAAAAHFLDQHDDLFGAGLGHRLDDGVLVREDVKDVADDHAGDQGNLRHEIGRAPCRESVCQYVTIRVVDGTLKQKIFYIKILNSDSQ